MRASGGSARWTRCRARTDRRRRRARGRGRRRKLTGLELLDERDDVAIIAKVLDEEHLIARDDHRLLWSLRLIATLDELGAGLIRRREIEDVGEKEPVIALRLQLAEVRGPIGEKQ